jgi:hypothetical protein
MYDLRPSRVALSDALNDVLRRVHPQQNGLAISIDDSQKLHVPGWWERRTYAAVGRRTIKAKMRIIGIPYRRRETVPLFTVVYDEPLLGCRREDLTRPKVFSVMVFNGRYVAALREELSRFATKFGSPEPVVELSPNV